MPIATVHETQTAFCVKCKPEVAKGIVTSGWTFGNVPVAIAVYRAIVVVIYVYDINSYGYWSSDLQLEYIQLIFSN